MRRERDVDTFPAAPVVPMPIDQILATAGPVHGHPIEPGHRIGLTDEELTVIDLLGRACTAFAQLHEHHPTDIDEFCRDIHVLQRQVMSRSARRAHPDVFAAMAPSETA